MAWAGWVWWSSRVVRIRKRLVRVRPRRSVTARVNSHSPQWRQLDTVDRGGQRHWYAVAVKATLKGLIWYDPQRLPSARSAPPQTWDQLVAVSQAHRDGNPTPWCMGMGPPPTSGWPGTDWIEEILLHQS